MAKKKGTIYLWTQPISGWGGPHDVVGFALAEDGRGLGSHLSSSVGFAKHDMGLTSDWKHDTYAEAYPDGFELVWVDDPESHDGFQAAFLLNQATAQEATHAP